MKVLFFARLFLGALLMIFIGSCNKLNEVYQDLDQNGYGGYQRTGLILTLTEDDYATATALGAPSYVDTGAYFISTEQAEAYIPDILRSNYSYYGNGSQATVVYDLAVDDSIALVANYTVTEADYEALGRTYGNFETEDNVISFLTDRYPLVNSDSAGVNALVFLTFQWYNGDYRTITNAYYHTSSGWVSTYLVSQEDYVSTDNGGYSNFDGDDDANLEHFFDSFLKDTLTINPSVGDIQYVTYLYYSGSTDYWVTPVQYDGVNWVIAQANALSYVTTSSLNYVKNGDLWEINAAILYTVTAADYAWIADNEVLGNESARENLGSYSNFYIADFYWSQEGINAAIAALLAERFPDATADQIYEVSYDIYTGVTSTTSGRFIADGAGNFTLEVID